MRRTSLLSRTPRTVRTSRLEVALDGRTVDVAVVRSSRRKRTIALSVGANGIRVLVPSNTSDAHIEELIERRAAWLQLRLNAVSQEPAPLQTGALLLYRGEPLRLVIDCAAASHPTVTRNGSELRVGLPAALEGDAHHEALRRALAAWYRAEAESVLLPLAADWAMKSGLVATRVLVRDQRRRWGSCATDGTIRLNWRLIMLEPDLADYVICHELVHLRHRHHQASFWAEVAALIPDHRERRKRLNVVAASTHLLD